MVFSSPEFLFLFMPAFFSLYYALRPAYRNAFILCASLIFYTVAAGYITLILLASILANYVIARAIAQNRANGKRYLILGVACNLAPLLFYKYTGFLLQTLQDGSTIFGAKLNLKPPPLLLPIGISFYTFHGISYLVDVYKTKVRPATSLIDFAMYTVNFPQLIAGPIVRYVEIVGAIRERPVTVDDVWIGLTRFVIGLTKKMVLADSMGNIADRIFALPQFELTTSLAWLGIITYTLQIYYDFSGYSDMAIGMGRMMGFTFPENFNQPYRAGNITEFWRRWHMTLTRWFRDYVYIPAGGNRAGVVRTYRNLLIVFLLCGLWHGAAYTFVVWGLYHGALLVIERALKEKFGFVPSGFPGQLATFFLVVVGWVFFRSTSIGAAFQYLSVMAHLHPDPISMFSVLFYLTNNYLAFLILGMAFAFIPLERFPRLRQTGLRQAGELAGIAALLVYDSALMAANGFNPFIYFRF